MHIWHKIVKRGQKSYEFWQQNVTKPSLSVNEEGDISSEDFPSSD